MLNEIAYSVTSVLILNTEFILINTKVNVWTNY